MGALRAPRPVVDGLLGIERARALDPPVAVMHRLAAAVARPGVVHDALVGTWLGHALHPLLTDLPIGFWTSASALDLIGGRRSRPAADRLLALGLASAVPTTATGLAEWLHADRRAQRVGVVHAAANTAGMALYTASLVARIRGRRGRGVVLALAGATAASLGGYLGGHLSVARKVGTRDAAFLGSAQGQDDSPGGVTTSSRTSQPGGRVSANTTASATAKGSQSFSSGGGL